jgi:hypothetical protein
MRRVLLEGMASDLIERALDPVFPPPAGTAARAENFFDLIHPVEA